MVYHHLSFAPTATESLKHNQEDQDYESQVLHIQVVSEPFPKLPGNCHHWPGGDPSKENLTSFYQWL
jgi:hypothetical protein